MPTTLNELVPRIGKRVRVKIAQPQTPTIPFIEKDALLVRIDEVNRVAYFNLGGYTRPVSWDNVEMLEGGLGPSDSTSGSSGTPW